MYVLVFHVPSDYADQVKEAIFASKAGCFSGYDSCCFEVEGTGQFRPLEGSSPFIGSSNKVEKVKEMRIETVVEDRYVADVVRALKRAHPYEVPSYHLIKVETIE
ncbi:MAG: NGG1p interacting factor NIF3 [Sphaerochaetaceae bacterium]|nr:NGG1p interacting factor NIF3 [Sphaerochaetaceae bacterium]